MTKSRLKVLLTYKNSGLVEKFSVTYGVSLKEAETIFKDMLRFLWLSDRATHLRFNKKNSNVPRIYIFEPLVVIDEMWHMFILDTKRYTDFSMQYFGRYMHHDSPPVGASKVWVSKKESEAMNNELMHMIQFSFEELGEKIAQRWFSHYHEVYSKKELARRQLENCDAA